MTVAVDLALVTTASFFFQSSATSAISCLALLFIGDFFLDQIASTAVRRTVIALRVLDRSKFEKIQLFIRQDLGCTFAVNIRPTSTVADLKLEIYLQRGITPEHQILSFGKSTMDHHSLQEYWITNNSTVELGKRGNGGMQNDSSSAQGRGRDPIPSHGPNGNARSKSRKRPHEDHQHARQVGPGDAERRSTFNTYLARHNIPPITFTSNKAEIRRAWMKLAHYLHPDRDGNADEFQDAVKLAEDFIKDAPDAPPVTFATKLITSSSDAPLLIEAPPTEATSTTTTIRYKGLGTKGSDNSPSRHILPEPIDVEEDAASHHRSEPAAANATPTNQREQAPPRKLKFWFDGSCTDNGQVTARGGWGVVCEENGETTELKGPIPKRYRNTPATNNRAELCALLALLYWMQESCIHHVGIRACTDSEYVYKIFKGESIPTKNLDFINDIRGLIEKNGITFDWVHTNSHTGFNDEDSLMNKRADELADEGRRMNDRKSEEMDSASSDSGDSEGETVEENGEQHYEAGSQEQRTCPYCPKKLFKCTNGRVASLMAEHLMAHHPNKRETQVLWRYRLQECERCKTICPIRSLRRHLESCTVNTSSARLETAATSSSTTTTASSSAATATTSSSTATATTASSAATTTTSNHQNQNQASSSPGVPSQTATPNDHNLNQQTPAKVTSLLEPEWVKSRLQRERFLFRSNWAPWVAQMRVRLGAFRSTRAYDDKQHAFLHVVNAVSECLSDPTVCNGNRGTRKRKQKRSIENPEEAANSPSQREEEEDGGSDTSSINPGADDILETLPPTRMSPLCRRVTELLNMGAVKRAIQKLLPSVVCNPKTQETRDALDLVHPNATRPPPRLPQRSILQNVTTSTVREVIVRRMARGSAPGLDCWTREILVPLAYDKDCLQGITDMVTYILNGNLCPELRQWMGAAPVIALSKNECDASEGVRPIAIESVWYRLAAPPSRKRAGCSYLRATIRSWQGCRECHPSFARSL
jgi:ribonuclease HI